MCRIIFYLTVGLASITYIASLAYIASLTSHGVSFANDYPALKPTLSLRGMSPTNDVAISLIKLVL